MKWDELGLPSDNGSTDLQDSARLAGIMVLFDWPQYIDLTHYVVVRNNGYYYVRHPNEYKYAMSRDNSVCLMAGLYKQGHEMLNMMAKIDGKDILSPSVKGHRRRCMAQQASWFQDLWLKLDIYWSAYIKPKAELNQLLCMLMVAGPEWVRLFKKHHKSWEDNLLEYWAYSFRQEPELAEHIIKKLREI